jgi:hypothetical protein
MSLRRVKEGDGGRGGGVWNEVIFMITVIVIEIVT